MTELPKIEDTTAVRFFIKEAEYISGKGIREHWVPVVSKVGEDRKGKPLESEYFYAEWKDAFGSRALELAAVGVESPARVRMKYNETIYRLLRERDVKIERDGKPSDVYRLNGTVSDYGLKRVLMEFNVRKREVKE